jgi:hypothetical protein
MMMQSRCAAATQQQDQPGSRCNQTAAGTKHSCSSRSSYRTQRAQQHWHATCDMQLLVDEGFLLPALLHVVAPTPQ